MTDIPVPSKTRPSAAAPSEEPLTVGSFFAQGRALVDARKMHLARVGMTPEHATALRMPDLEEKPAAPPAVGERLPEPNRAGAYEPPKLPKLPGVNVQVGVDDGKQE